MKDYQQDKYENFFLNLKASRESLAAFADFTAEAVAAPDTNATVAGYGPPLATTAKVLRQEMVDRRTQGGSSQSGTNTEKMAYAAFKTFVQATDKKVLAPYLYDHAATTATYYPEGLGALTQAPVQQRLTRLTAYTEALETSPDKAVKAQGPPARALLTQYQQASTAKTTARTAVQQTIGELGPAALAVAEALWDVHTAALLAHRRQPAQARQYFDYASLPNRVNAKKPAVLPKAG